MPLINQLTTIYSEVDVFMNEMLGLVETLKQRQKLEERMLEQTTDKDSPLASYHRGSIVAYADVIRLLTT
jgi:hypothetical protein